MPTTHDHDPDGLDVLEIDAAERSAELQEAMASGRRRRVAQAPEEHRGVEGLLDQWAASSDNLTQDEEITLLRATKNMELAPEVREAAVTRLVQGNARRVFQVVNKLRADRNRVDMDELYAAGLNGLNTAIMKWDEKRASSAQDMGTARLSASANMWIYKMVMEEFRRQIAPDLSERDFFLLYRLDSVRETLRAEHGIEQPTAIQLTAALHEWALQLCRKNRIIKTQRETLGRVRVKDVEAELVNWAGPDDFTPKELRSRGAVRLEDVERLLGIDRTQRIGSFDQELGTEGGRTLGDTLADDQADSGQAAAEIDGLALLGGLSRALGDRLDDLAYRHSFRVGRVHGLAGHHAFGEGFGVVPSLGLDEEELGLTTGERKGELTRRRDRQAQRLGGLAPRPELLWDIPVTNGGTPSLWSLLGALRVRMSAPASEESDAPRTSPCPSGEGRGMPAEIHDTHFACTCGCGAQGDVFDYWVGALGLPPESAEGERRRYGRMAPRRNTVVAGETVLQDASRARVVKDALRGR